ncbi:site-2 protease family protein [Microvirga puerhi]|uniref:Zinc metalloprotease n=1 Tax=Microvirga puerhi TaxID=2876078 RepID=A0ABS7VPN7_9HYPH|nr:site-2 protease family protein [Microvirga puerhi]MBZ6077480.1 site-2 protease family protein [Microvirga puerhi]
MVWSIPIARIAGTAVRIHVTFLLFLVWIGASYWRMGGREAAIEGVLFMMLLFACVLAHEFGHILTARHFGIRTPEVTLWPIGGIASLERIPSKPREELLVAIAGPAVNVVLAAVIILVLGIGLDTVTTAAMDDPRTSLLARLAAANIFLVVFNLLPVFPMDGGRVLRALLAMRMDRLNATRIAARIGQGAAFLFALIGLFVNPMLIIIGLFVYLAATAEAQDMAFRDATQGLPVRSVMISSLETLPTTATLSDAVDLMLRTSQKEFPVVDGAQGPRGLLTRENLIHALHDGGPTAPVLEAMTREIPTVSDGQPFDTALALLTRTRAPALFVLDEASHLIGLVTLENIGEMMMVRSARPDWHFRNDRPTSPRTVPPIGQATFPRGRVGNPGGNNPYGQGPS